MDTFNKWFVRAKLFNLKGNFNKLRELKIKCDQTSKKLNKLGIRLDKEELINLKLMDKCSKN